ncbi:alcohol dehydrogenase catalytic domain-containing protein [Gulosibacter chungangensis]|uniref:Alcohol dehydrogenase catalytic domain-containing protein n=1 Tax=Gulosibacter chungangensis TaxID=979746 RepID=A0A7J5B9N8_9MICO|nr:alcohol dehydrogenase catalytic domain-containing protein [Gulosibacter chungangensis]
MLMPLACGICGTDLHVLGVPQLHSAQVGVVLGHDYIAEAAEVGDEVSPSCWVTAWW